MIHLCVCMYMNYEPTVSRVHYQENCTQASQLENAFSHRTFLYPYLSYYAYNAFLYLENKQHNRDATIANVESGISSSL